jgi:hypothetical protein
MYPYSESRTPIKRGLTLEDALDDDDYTEELFPHVVSKNRVMNAGCPLDEWNDLYETTLIYAWEKKIPVMVFVWDDDRFEFPTKNWTDVFDECPPGLRNMITEAYNIGPSLPLLESPYRTIESFAVFNSPLQMFLSPISGEKSSSTSRVIPKHDYTNPSCVAIIHERCLRAYCHASLATNLGNLGNSDYITKLLSYSSSHGFTGVVFHCARATKGPVRTAVANMKTNIVDGIRNYRNPVAEFLLETPAGQKNETLTDVNDFCDFIELIRLEVPIGVCVDTCHVFAAGYEPLNYLRAVHERVGVKLVHFNDSVQGWGSGVDRHADIGFGRIPYPLLIKVAEYCHVNGIDAVFEC